MSQAEAKDQEKKSVLKKIFDVVYYVVIVAIILLSLFYTFFTLTTKDGVTSFFGYILTSVESGSMTGTFEVDDVILTKEVDLQDVQKGDIISFYYFEPNYKQKIIVTHRVIEVQPNRFITQGDVANKNNSIDQVESVPHGDVISKYTGIKIPGLGKVTDFLKTSTGFFCCILIPIFLFLFWQIYVFTKTLLEAKSLSKQKKINDEARALAEQMLKEMQQSQATNEAAADNPSAEANE